MRYTHVFTGKLLFRPLAAFAVLTFTHLSLDEFEGIEEIATTESDVNRCPTWMFTDITCTHETECGKDQCQ